MVQTICISAIIENMQAKNIISFLAILVLKKASLEITHISDFIPPCSWFL